MLLKKQWKTTYHLLKEGSVWCVTMKQQQEQKYKTINNWHITGAVDALKLKKYWRNTWMIIIKYNSDWTQIGVLIGKRPLIDMDMSLASSLCSFVCFDYNKIFLNWNWNNWFKLNCLITYHHVIVWWIVLTHFIHSTVQRAEASKIGTTPTFYAV